MFPPIVVLGRNSNWYDGVYDDMIRYDEEQETETVLAGAGAEKRRMHPRHTPEKERDKCS